MEKYKVLEINSMKRLLVIGDIHGQYDLLMRLLLQAQYNHNTDTLVTTGDMIDRGKDSVKVVDFFSGHPNRYATKGNHEDMFLTRDNYLNDDNGGINGSRATRDSLLRSGKSEGWLRDQLKDLPLVLDISFNGNVIRFLHAEIPASYDEPYIQTKLSNRHIDSYFDAGLVWSRDDINNAALYSSPDLVAKRITKNQPIPTFVGHTATKYLMPNHKGIYKLGTRTYMDTGQGALACMDIFSNKVYYVDDKPLFL